MGKLSKDKNDIYYRLAKQKGYRSRSAFKLLQVDDYFHIFENCSYIVDLCGAPGGWSQVASARLKDITDKKIISVDLQQFAPIEDVDIIIGDMTNQTTLNEIMAKANKRLIDLVICDGAPDVTGFNEFDVYIQNQLVYHALNITLRLLKEGGKFITKLFKGKYTNQVIQLFLLCFDTVTISKPKACRNASFESFIVCEGYKLTNDTINKLRKSDIDYSDILIINQLVEETDKENDGFNFEDANVKFIQVGNDEYDADKTYNLESTDYTKVLNPVQMPIDPPYKFYIDNLKGKPMK